MILLIILAIIAVLLITVTVAVVSIFGTGAIILLGDVIVCVFIIGFVIKVIIQKRNDTKW